MCSSQPKIQSLFFTTAAESNAFSHLYLLFPIILFLSELSFHLLCLPPAHVVHSEKPLSAEDNKNTDLEGTLRAAWKLPPASAFLLGWKQEPGPWVFFRPPVRV